MVKPAAARCAPRSPRVNNPCSQARALTAQASVSIINSIKRIFRSVLWYTLQSFESSVSIVNKKYNLPPQREIFPQITNRHVTFLPHAIYHTSTVVLPDRNVAIYGSY